MSSNNFIWIAHVPKCLWDFFLKVLEFSEYFWCSKTITRFFWNCFRIKNKFGKKEKKQILSYPAEPRVP
jgi:hypothetical protein